MQIQSIIVTVIYCFYSTVIYSNLYIVLCSMKYKLYVIKIFY